MGVEAVDKMGYYWVDMCEVANDPDDVAYVTT